MSLSTHTSPTEAPVVSIPLALPSVVIIPSAPSTIACVATPYNFIASSNPAVNGFTFILPLAPFVPLNDGFTLDLGEL